MAKRIFLVQEDIDSFLEKAKDEFGKLTSGRVDGAKISLSFQMSENKQRASLLFSQKAWIKMFALVNYNQKEVGWHGTVTRVNDNTFKVEDILIFPQEVTGSTVVPDQEEYSDWLNNVDDDIFNKIRFHGHSHVNMGVSPSGVDTNYRRDVLDNFKTNTGEGTWFYIFLIVNKSGDFNIEIYDMENNIRYDKSDIDVEVIMDGDEYLSLFLEDAKSFVKTKTYVAPKTTYPNYSYQGTAGSGKGYKTWWEEEQERKKKASKKMPESAVDDRLSERELRELYGDEYFE